MTTAHNATPSNERRGPTPKQLRYLRSLANQRGESFATPRTASEASREINRLKTRKRTPRSDACRERREISRDMANLGDAAQVRGNEITGYGSRATWNADRSDAREHSRTSSNRPSDSDRAGRPTELGRYATTSDGERIVCGQRVNGVVQLTDVSAARCGPPLVIERDLTSKAELDAIVADYLAQAAVLGAIPAITTALSPAAA